MPILAVRLKVFLAKGKYIGIGKVFGWWREKGVLEKFGGYESREEK